MVLQGYSEKQLGAFLDDPAYWAEVRKQVLQGLEGTVSATMKHGADTAGLVGLVVDEEAVNLWVLNQVDNYTNAWWEGLETTTRKGLRSAIANMEKTGAPLSSLEKSIEPLFGKVRAKRIAATEVTRLYDLAAREAHRSAGVIEEEWHTVKDALVDPLCEAEEGNRFPLDEGPFPPLHVNCRCSRLPVTPEGGVLGKPPTTLEDSDYDPEIANYHDAVVRDYPPHMGSYERRGERDLRVLDKQFKDKDWYQNLKKFADSGDPKTSWLSSFGSKNMRTAAESLAQGKVLPKGFSDSSVKRLKGVLSSINKSPRIPDELYRGMANLLPGAVGQYKPGFTFDIPLASFSYSKDIAKNFDGSVIYRVVNSKGLPLGPLAVAAENEVLVSGRFVVRNVVREMLGKTVMAQVVEIEQVGVLSL